MARCWNLVTGACDLVFAGHSFRVSSVAEHHGSVFTGSWDYCVRRWKDDGECDQSYSEGRARWERSRMWTQGESAHQHYGLEHRMQEGGGPGRGPSPLRGGDPRARSSGQSFSDYV